jgi:hypothetical protein
MSNSRAVVMAISPAFAVQAVMLDVNVNVKSCGTPAPGTALAHW